MSSTRFALALLLSTACATRGPSGRLSGPARASAQPRPAVAAPAPTPAYAGTMQQVMDQYTADIAAVNERVTGMAPAPGASADKVVSALLEQGELYLRIRHKLTGLDPHGVTVFSEGDDALIRRAAKTNGQLREKGVRAADNATRAWTTRCERELESLDGVLAERYGRARQVAEVEGLETSKAAAGDVLAALEAARGSSWLAGRLARAGIAHRPGVYGQPTRSLANCPVLSNPLAPMGPIASGSGPKSLPPELSLPTLPGASPALGEGLRVYIAKNALYVGKDRQHLLDLGPDAKVGFAAQHKSEPNSLLLLPAKEAFSRRSESRAAEVLVFVDAGVPFRAFMEVLNTLSQAGYAQFLLVTGPRHPADVSGFAFSASDAADAALVVLIVNLGYALRFKEQRIGENCGDGPTEGMAVPKVNGRYDPLGLQTCISRIETRETADVWSTRIAANPDTTYADLIDVVAAIVTNQSSFGFVVPGRR